jgi:hypothetical protein
MTGVVSCRLNKPIAEDLGTSEITVKVQRSHAAYTNAVLLSREPRRKFPFSGAHVTVDQPPTALHSTCDH